MFYFVSFKCTLFTLYLLLMHLHYKFYISCFKFYVISYTFYVVSFEFTLFTLFLLLNPQFAGGGWIPRFFYGIAYGAQME